MSKYEYNTVVIGAGSAGLVSAYITAALRAKVALIEKHRMGGDCLNTGCVPSKALLRSAKMLSYARRAQEFGFDGATVDFDFGKVMGRVQQIIAAVAPHDSVERYTKLGVECIEGSARIVTPHRVEVNGRTLICRNIIVATGARPRVPSIQGLDKIDYLTSDSVWNLRERPKRLVVLGGGPIGSELAQAFSRLGAEVTMIEKGPQFLGREDVEVVSLMTERFRAEGVRILTRHQAKSFRIEHGKKIITCDHQGEFVDIEFDEVIVALGRQANVSGFGLEELGVELAPEKTIVADAFLKTNVPSIYVCGDVTGPYQFTHVAAHQAWFAAINSLFSPFKRFKVDYRVIPWTTFTDPEVARVGLNEKEAKEKNIPFEVATFGIDDLDRAIVDSEAHGFVKVLTVPGKDKILGVTIVGSHAGDIITEFILAMKHGLGLNDILGTIHIYPTLGEANKYAAGVWRKAHIPQLGLKIVSAFHAWRRW
jgi:pyruvate/2-oxoglutarate dehydrogenase complex dihydrolipoamide dehydrogenase (E3) component